jgi:2-polyprenyl-3-methyl-5-hydroxy-6-metoxy-1,4-benzoquinol methylase
MLTEKIHPLEPDMLELFAQKGKEGESSTPQPYNANGLKVRRIMQIIRDLARNSVEEIRVLDVACGEGVYAIETALRGAQLHAFDARTERMDNGKQCAERLGLTNLRFEKNDVRHVSLKSHGEYDIIYFLGILYHLDVPDSFHILENLYTMCRQFMVIDSHISLSPEDEVHYKDRKYKGVWHREHRNSDPASVRKSRQLSSIDNSFSFWFTKDSLVTLLVDVGFTSVFECHAPLEPSKPGDRITLVACKGSPVKISTYPWVNEKTEEEIQATLKTGQRSTGGLKQQVKSIINKALRPLGFRIIGI